MKSAALILLGLGLCLSNQVDATIASDEATRSLLWGEGLQALGQGEKAVGNLQAATGFWTKNPALFKAGLGNAWKGFGTGAAGDYVKAVTEGRRLLDAEEVTGDIIHSGGHPVVHRAAEVARNVGRAEALVGAGQAAVGEVTNNQQLTQNGAATAAAGVATAATANGVARATRCKGCLDPDLQQIAHGIVIHSNGN